MIGSEVGVECYRSGSRVLLKCWALGSEGVTGVIGHGVLQMWFWNVTGVGVECCRSGSGVLLKWFYSVAERVTHVIGCTVLQKWFWSVTECGCKF